MIANNSVYPITRRQNFRLVQIETNCRQHSKMKNKCHRVENIVRKRRNCLLQAISPFSHNVFHSYRYFVRQNAALRGNGLFPPPHTHTHNRESSYSLGSMEAIEL